MRVRVKVKVRVRVVGGRMASRMASTEWGLEGVYGTGCHSGGRSTRVRFSPTHMSRRPSSQPLITWPAPTAGREREGHETAEGRGALDR